MSNKKEFYEMVSELIDFYEKCGSSASEHWPNGFEYWLSVKNAESEKPTFTEVGKRVFDCMRNTNDKETSKHLAELLGISSRSVAGAMIKLVNDGYVAKEKNENITLYYLTELGKTI